MKSAFPVSGTISTRKLVSPDVVKLSYCRTHCRAIYGIFKCQSKQPINSLTHIGAYLITTKNWYQWRILTETYSTASTSHIRHQLKQSNITKAKLQEKFHSPCIIFL